KPAKLYLSSFRCMTRLVADEVAKSRNPYPYIDGLIFQITQNASAVRVRHVEREQGRSGYTLRKLVRLWLSMLVNFSVLPPLLMPLRALLIRVRDLQDSSLVQRFAQQLQPNRQLPAALRFCKTAR